VTTFLPKAPKRAFTVFAHPLPCFIHPFSHYVAVLFSFGVRMLPFSPGASPARQQAIGRVECQLATFRTTSVQVIDSVGLPRESWRWKKTGGHGLRDLRMLAACRGTSTPRRGRRRAFVDYVGMMRDAGALYEAAVRKRVMGEGVVGAVDDTWPTARR